MDRTRRRSSAPKWIVAFLVMAGVALPVSAAAAGTLPDTKLGWSRCLWPAGKTITVALDPAVPLPPPAPPAPSNQATARWARVLPPPRRGRAVGRVGQR